MTQRPEAAVAQASASTSVVISGLDDIFRAGRVSTTSAARPAPLLPIIQRPCDLAPCTEDLGHTVRWEGWS